MRLRQARKIADRVFDLSPSGCPYDEAQLYRAFERLHRSWLNRLVLSPSQHDPSGFWLSVTFDWTRSNRVWSTMIRIRHFPRTRARLREYRYNANVFGSNEPVEFARVRTTWKTKIRTGKRRRLEKCA